VNLIAQTLAKRKHDLSELCFTACDESLVDEPKVLSPSYTFPAVILSLIAAVRCKVLRSQLHRHDRIRIHQNGLFSQALTLLTFAHKFDSPSPTSSPLKSPFSNDNRDTFLSFHQLDWSSNVER